MLRVKINVSNIWTGAFKKILHQDEVIKYMEVLERESKVKNKLHNNRRYYYY